jgi:RHS repeat-associated protein
MSLIASSSSGLDRSLRRFEYGYDRHSNLVKEAVSGDSPTPGLREGTQWAAFDAGDQICATARGATDPGVTCTSSVSGQTSFAHDNAGNLTSAAGGATQDLDGLGLAYNLPGQTASITPPGAMTAIPQAYDGVEQDRRTSSGSTQMAYGFAGLSHQATPVAAGSSAHAEWFVRDPQGKVLAMVDATSPTAPTVAGYYLMDDQDSVMAIINPAATSATRYLYEPYGQTIRTWTDSNLGTSNSLYTESTTATTPAVDYNPWRYVSGYHDKATGFLKFGTRYYMPGHATWTQPDPKSGDLERPLSLNAFSYAAASPTNVTDPRGRSWWDDATGYLESEAGTDLLGGIAITVGLGIIGYMLPVTAPLYFGLIAAGVAWTVMGAVENCPAEC